MVSSSSTEALRSSRYHGINCRIGFDHRGLFIFMAKSRTSLKAEAQKEPRARATKLGRPPKSVIDKEAGGRDQYFSRAVGKALEVLELLQAESLPLTINEISQRIQLSKTSAFRLLRTLQTLGSVTMDGRGQYKL